MISIPEYFAMSRELENKHALFYKMWEMGSPVFTTEIPTAAIAFDRKTGMELQYLFNPEFYAKLTPYQRIFIVAHEMMHVILNHGLRTVHLNNPEVCNVALDVVVNETLYNGFGFDKSKLGEEFCKNLCSADTVFPDDPSIPKDECFEYYYDLIMKGKSKFNLMPSIDYHGYLKDLTSNDVRKILGEAGKDLSDSEVAGLKEQLEKQMSGSKEEKEQIQQAGNMKAGNELQIVLKKRVYKRKWETVIKKWMLQFKDKLKTYEQWAMPSRRLNTMPSDLFLPSEYEDEVKDKTRIEVWFFQDVSGSCVHLAERFFKAASSLPPDRFAVRLFTFDTEVKETTIKSGKIYGGGGTSFSCIEQAIQRKMKKDEVEYPKAVFVITDGYGDSVKPEKPENWHWFLTESGSKSYIPANSLVYDLKDYE